MSKILGLDLGTNSLGWAVVDTEKEKVLGTGVRIFQEGVENLGQGAKEESKNAHRRLLRQSRKQFFRKRLRKIKLLEVMIKHNMCPLTQEELKSWKYYDKTEGKASIVFPDTPEFNAWLNLDPYELRKKGLDEQLNRKEFGRILYHLIQRRGFASNRKVNSEGVISKGNDSNAGISDALENIGEDKPYRTLGEYLYSIKPKERTPFKYNLDAGEEKRVRARYTLREMYVNEFNLLWQKQAKGLGLDSCYENINKTILIGNPYKNGAHSGELKSRLQHKLDYLNAKKGTTAKLEINRTKPENTLLKKSVSVSLKDLLAGGEEIKQNESVLFYQRPLKIQKHLLYECALEKTIKGKRGKVLYPGKKPVPKSHPMFEMKRAYEFVNNIRYGNNIKLSDEQRHLIVNEVINKKDKAFKFKEIPKKLKLQHEKFNYADDASVSGNKTHKLLMPLFDSKIWEKHQNEIWHCFHFYDNDDLLFEKLSNDFGLATKHKDKILGELKEDGSTKGKIVLDDNHSGYSLKAIKNVLPYLKRGFGHSDAVLLGGVKNAFKDRWENFSDSHKEIEQKVMAIQHNQENKEGDVINEIKNYLTDEENKFGFEQNDKDFLGLYHHSQETEKKEEKTHLDTPPNLTNPIARQSILQLQGVVNDLINKFLDKGEHFDFIKVEMGRSLKQSRDHRIQQQNNQKANQVKNEEARERLAEYGLAPSRNNIHKYLLWQELAGENGIATCPYTGKPISITDLFNNNKFQIEHIIPYSRSLDDSFSNKTICEARENGRKGEKTPFEFYGDKPEKWSEIENRAYKLLPYTKAKRFTIKKVDNDDFLSRQLNDTRYISREAARYLETIVKQDGKKRVRVLPGSVTAKLRKQWGLENILNPPVKVNEEAPKGPVWMDKENKQNIIPVFAPRPKNKKGEIVLKGNVEKEKFKSKYLKTSINAEEKSDGEYYAKLKISNEPVELVRVLRDKPELDSGFILFYGKGAKNGKFDTKYLPQLVPANLEENEPYWAKIKIEESKTEIQQTQRRGKKLNAGKDEVLIYGNVVNGIFSSQAYNCSTDLEDGKYHCKVLLDKDNITFHKVKNEKPVTQDGQILLTGHVNEEQLKLHIDSNNLYQATGEKPGVYWSIFNIDKQPLSLTKVYNDLPDKVEFAKGNIINSELTPVDLETGEILPQEKGSYFFASKERDDHRHHAIDALVVAMTEQKYVQKLSTQSANRKSKLRQKDYDKKELYFPIPWNGMFRLDAEKAVNNILVSHKKNNKVLSIKTTKDPKTGKLNTGIAARGQLHKEFVFGERQSPYDTEPKYHIKKSLSDLQTHKHVAKIVDLNIKQLIEHHLRENHNIDTKSNYKIPKNAFFKAGKDGNSLPVLFLKNKNGEQVPIKTVRIKENLSNAVKLKETNQYVNPRNNYMVLIYENHEGELDEHILTLWEAAELKRQGEDLRKLPANGNRFITSLQTNDLFLLGLPENANPENMSNSELSPYLYRVQKLSAGYYTFRHHLASTINNNDESISIQSFKAWKEYNPIKVKVNRVCELIR